MTFVPIYSYEYWIIIIYIIIIIIIIDKAQFKKAPSAILECYPWVGYIFILKD